MAAVPVASGQGVDVLQSINPATGAPVASGAVHLDRVSLACDAAAAALPPWRSLSMDARWEVLLRFREAIASNQDALAQAISSEMGKLLSEAHIEISALIHRFALVRGQIARDLSSGALPGHPNEVLSFRPHGVVGVIGPFNFPLHLCHAHVVPALLLGNTVVVKPSEVAPLAAECYAKAAVAAGIPPGVLNLVHGGGAAGAALCTDKRVRAVAFTGSWAVGRKIRAATVDRPELLVALEMGGKNTCYVAEDADLSQAAHEVAVGGYLTTGQRCTCTDRVLIHRSVVEPFVERLAAIVSGLRFGPPDRNGSFAGPLATRSSRERFLAARAKAVEAGGETIATGGVAEAAEESGFYVPATAHLLPDGIHHVAGYTDTELFGPDLHLEPVAGDEEAITVLEDSPYGFATSVFCASRPRFQHFLGAVETGILNWNRSTNQASPRLPFGGLKRSGNHRPAGAYAPRNLAVPVAAQLNQPGVFVRRPELASKTNAPDLDALEQRYQRESNEAGSAGIHYLAEVARPMDGHFPESERCLERLYAGDRVVREKKPMVFDHLRSHGAWMASIDENPLVVLDGMSQTATLPAGFSPDCATRAYAEGAFDDVVLVSDDSTAGSAEVESVLEQLRARLLRLVPGYTTASFVNSGAESCEKALALCHAQFPGRSKVLAFEGGFHGRTLLALAATHNPKKRGPFEFVGFEASFAPYPTWWQPDQPEPATPAGFQDAILTSDWSRATGLCGDDCLLMEEVAALQAVVGQLASGEFFATMIEPMQSEGGDRYATARFHRLLRMVTRKYDVPLVLDEVQCGFGLSGEFAWHHAFDYVTADGKPDQPDCVTFAKRAQLGVVLSSYEDREPSSCHLASVVRGALFAALMETDPDAKAMEFLVRQRLAALAGRFPDLVQHPRNKGYALAFDLPSPEHLTAYLGQRFWRGVVVFGAGQRTVRYRLSKAFLEHELTVLFQSVEASLAWLLAHPGLNKAPTWVNLPGDKKPKTGWPQELRLRVVEPTIKDADKAALLDAIVALEASVYEPARRDSREKLALAFEQDGVAVIAETLGGALAGCALAAPLERFSSVGGVKEDPFFGRGNTAYAIASTVAESFQGRGLGRALKASLVRATANRTGTDGQPRYQHIAGRTRVGLADAMGRLNRSLGAYEVHRIEDAYEDGGTAIYYRMPAPVPALSQKTDTSKAKPKRVPDFSQGISRPFEQPPETLVNKAVQGGLFGPVVNKLTVMNYVTKDYVRALEWVGALTPSQPHLYVTSSRDETFDKTVRLLRIHRPQAQVVLGLEGGYLGHTTAAARSLSDPAVHGQGPAYFRTWKRAGHPAKVGSETTLAGLRKMVDDAGGAEKVLGLFLEPVQERTGACLDEAFLIGLAEFREDTGVPVVFVEPASACYRSGEGAFFADGSTFVPDVLTWWGGGQVGFLHVSKNFRVATPLTLVSTWDGDELSLIRIEHQLRAARRIDILTQTERMVEALSPAVAAGVMAQGKGLYWALHVGDRTSRLIQALRGIVRLRGFPNGHVAVCPPLDASKTDFDALKSAVAKFLEQNATTPEGDAA